MIYQLMFAIITPALITGAFAERMKFSAMAVFLSSGRCSSTAPWRTWSGESAACSTRRGGRIPIARFRRRHRRPRHLRRLCAWSRALYLGKRIGYPHDQHAAALHGAQLHRRLPAVGGLVWIQRGQRARRQARWPPAPSSILTSRLPRPPSAGRSRNGSTTASPPRSARSRARWRDWWPSLPLQDSCSPCPRSVIGLVAGVFCFFMVFVVKSGFGYDDSLDAFGVHGAGGTLGALLTGIFATRPSIPPSAQDAPPAPSTATGASCSIRRRASPSHGSSPSSARWSCCSLWTRRSDCASRPEDESAGLDLSQHGEEGYDLNS